MPVQLAVALVAIVLGLAGVAAAGVSSPGEIGPASQLTANGHLLNPAGRLTTVGDLPTGSAVLPGGHYLWVAGTPKGSSPVEGPTQGDQDDVIHIFTVAPTTGRRRGSSARTAGHDQRQRADELAAPVSGVGTAQPEGIAVSPDGRYLVVALNGADSAVVVNLSSLAAEASEI